MHGYWFFDCIKSVHSFSLQLVTGFTYNESDFCYEINYCTELDVLPEAANDLYHPIGN